MYPSIHIPPEQFADFNARAEALLAGLHAVSGPWREAPQPSLFPPALQTYFIALDRYCVKSPAIYDMEHNFVAFALFKEGETTIGLSAADMARYVALIQDVGQVHDLQAWTSASFVGSYLLAWLEKKRLGQERETFSGRLRSAAMYNIQRYDYWLPVAQTSVEEEIQLGHVTITPDPDEMQRRWLALMEINPRPAAVPWWFNPRIGEDFPRIAGRWKGVAGALVSLYGEEERTKTQAYQDAQLALHLLRIFSPAGVEPLLVSHCSLLSLPKPLDASYFYAEEGDIDAAWGDGYIEEVQAEWVITRDAIAQMRELGLNDLDALLRIKHRTSFQQTLLEAFTVYGQLPMMRELPAKLLHLFSALEMVWLRDATEAPLPHVPRRMARFTAENADEYHAILTNAQDVYISRPQLMQHAYTLSSFEHKLLRTFMSNARRSFLKLAHEADRFPDKMGLIKHLNALH